MVQTNPYRSPKARMRRRLPAMVRLARMVISGRFFNYRNIFIAKFSISATKANRIPLYQSE